MKELTFDKDGYPTDESLDFIAQYDPREHGDSWADLLSFLFSVWNWNDFVRMKGSRLELVTGGWSGNESVIEALGKNILFWAMFWQRSERGGYFLFKIPAKSRKGEKP